MQIAPGISLTLWQGNHEIKPLGRDKGDNKAKIDPEKPFGLDVQNLSSRTIVVYVTIGNQHANTVMENVSPVGYTVGAGQRVTIQEYRHNDVPGENLMWPIEDVLTLAVHHINSHTVTNGTPSITGAQTSLVEKPVRHRLGQTSEVMKFRQEIVVESEPLCAITIVHGD